MVRATRWDEREPRGLWEDGEGWGSGDEKNEVVEERESESEESGNVSEVRDDAEVGVDVASSGIDTYETAVVAATFVPHAKGRGGVGGMSRLSFGGPWGRAAMRSVCLIGV
jgi:hypothetical protein